MKKTLQGFLFTATMVIFVSCFFGNAWAGSSANSNAGSSSNVNAAFNGYTTNNNNPIANAGANSQSNSGVNFNSNPSAMAQGGTSSSGVNFNSNPSASAQGGNASAQGGTSNSGVNNNIAVSPTVSPTINSTVNPTINPTVNAGQTVSPQTQSSVNIDSHAVNNNKYINRQFLPAGIDNASETMQYFGKWNAHPWNVFPPEYGKWRPISNKKIDIHYDKMWVHFYHKFPPVKEVNFVKYGAVHSGVLVASVAVRVRINQGTDDAQAIIASIARKNGGNNVEILSSSAIQVPTSKGWHIGTGAGAAGVIGSDEKASISGAGGTGMGKSSIKMEFSPFMQARIWRNGRLKDGKNLQKTKNQQSFKDHKKEWLINRKTK